MREQALEHRSWLPGFRVVVPLVAGRHWLIARAIRDDGRPALIKLPVDDSRALAQLERDHEVTARLAEPGLLATRGVERHGDVPVLVYEDFAGEPVRVGDRAWREGRAAFDLALGVAEILARLHAAGAIHKRLHPGAIWIDRAGRIKLSDLAQASVPDLPAPAVADARAGVIAYLAPEQSGRTHQVLDARADLYALGAVLYALLAGAPPFAGDDPLELLHAHLTQLPAPLAARAPGVPAPLAAIVHTLLAKNPEERYASATALIHDLRAAAALPKDAAFTPRRDGQAARLRLPERLYGRDDARRALQAALARAAAGDCVTCLVAAPSGGGKSALVHELADEPDGRRFVAGKFDPQRAAEPFSAVTRALAGLLRQVLSGSESEVAAWRERLRRGVGAGLSVLAETWPEVQAIVGPQPPPAPLPAGEGRQRLQLTLQRFIACFAAPGRPLVLFLDDLQWADAASLRLCEALAAGVEVRHLLLVGAYRDNEVATNPPLLAHLNTLRALTPPPIELTLGPLTRDDLEHLLRDALGGSDGSLRALADEVLRRTGGNPLFAREFLRFLHREARLRKDGAGAWTWSLAGVDEERVPETIADLLGAELRALPPASRRAVQVAACLGARVDTDLLAEVLATTADDAAARLQPAVDLGLVVPTGPEDQAGRAPLRFFHDRVRQTAEAELDPGGRPALHLAIVRALLARPRDGDPGEALFELVAHFARAEPAMHDPALRRRGAELHLQAARRARATASYDAALAHLAGGIALLDPHAWDDPGALCFELHAEQAACTYLSGAFDRAVALLDALLARARGPREQAHVHALRVTLHVTTGDPRAAIDEGRRGLRLLGVDLPDDDDSCRRAVGENLAAIHAELATRPFAALMDAPPLRDPGRRAALELLQELLTPANMTMPDLYALIIATQVRLTIDHGHTDLSAFTYVIFGFFLATVRRQYAEAEAFGRFALDLNERRGSPELGCRLRFVFASYTHFSRPLGDVLADLQRARKDGLESGDYNYLSFASSHQIIAMLALGRPLPEVAAATDEAIALMDRTKVASSRAVLTVARQFAAALSGDTVAPHSLSDAGFDLAAFRERLRKGNLTFALRWSYLAELQLCVLHDRAAEAIALLREVGPAIEAGYGFYFTTELPLFAALAVAAASGESVPEDDAARSLERYHAQLLAWSEHAPATYAHRARLVDGERARLRGDLDAALAAYDDAIELADRHGFAWHAALACERAGRLLLARGRRRLAVPVLRDACERYDRWGARPKAAELRRLLPELAAPSHVSADMSRDPQSELDLRSVLRAAQALAAERDFDGLIRAIMRIVVVTAGASRGVLALQEHHGLAVVARLTAADDARPHIEARPLEACPDVPATPIRLAFRTARTIASDDPELADALRSDPVLAARRPRSLLCLPLVLQGQRLGALYLENEVTAGAFTPARIETLRLLSGQIAVSLEQARLVARLQEARAAAEAASRAKSTFLANMSHELRTPLNAILGYAELIGEIAGERGDDELHDDIRRIQSAGAHLLGLISDILDLSKIEADRLDLLVDRFAIGPLVREAADAVRPALQRAGNRFVLELADDLGDMQSDPVRVRQILLNVLSNAAKFTQDGTVTLRARRDGDRLVFSVEDTGIGMTSEAQQRVFEAFQQADTSAARRVGGAGLGLTITRRLCEALGGSIAVVSAPGRGSVFTIDLPATSPGAPAST